jgi:hypothetical protein
MKSYAKTFSGSIYVVDRRHDGVSESEAVRPSGQVAGEGR